MAVIVFITVQSANSNLFTGLPPGATGYCYGEFNLNTTDDQRWHEWFINGLHGDPDCVFQALYNCDAMKGKPTVEKAMLDAMAFSPTIDTVKR